MQRKIAINLYNKCNFKDDKNILIFRSSGSNSRESDEITKMFDEIHAIPSLSRKNRFFKWVNFFIYIVSFSKIFLSNYGKGNLIIGNLLFNGNRFIINFFSKFWCNIFILDEGTSTLSIYAARNIPKIRFLDKVLLTYNSKKKLIFYSIFNLPANELDKVWKVENLFNLDLESLYRSRGDGKKNLLFIGSPLVEAKIITKEYFERLIQKIRENNPDHTIAYLVHPKEYLIMKEKDLLKKYKVEILKLDMRLEEYLVKNPLEFSVISSCISTGFIYASTILEDLAQYQAYVLKEECILHEYATLNSRLVYQAMKNKCINLSYQEIQV